MGKKKERQRDSLGSIRPQFDSTTGNKSPIKRGKWGRQFLMIEKQKGNRCCNPFGVLFGGVQFLHRCSSAVRILLFIIISLCVCFV